MLTVQIVVNIFYTLYKFQIKNSMREDGLKIKNIQIVSNLYLELIILEKKYR